MRRTIKFRTLLLSLLPVLTMLFSLSIGVPEAHASAVIFTVLPAAVDIVPDGRCSLVEALINANADRLVHPDCTPSSGSLGTGGPFTINLGAGSTYAVNTPYVDPDLAYNGSAADDGPTGLPPIVKNITIDGAGATITRPSSAAPFRFYYVRSPLQFPGAKLTLVNLTLTNGYSTASHGGGAILAPGTVIIYNCLISGNTSTTMGGAIVNSYYGLEISNSRILNNHAKQGGGVFLDNVTNMSMNTTTVSGNTADAEGGGIEVSDGAEAQITTSTLARNNALTSKGGGLFVAAGSTLNLSNSTVSNNKGTGGGGIGNIGTANIIYDTIAYNTATAGTGGGLFNVGGTVTVKNSIIARNSAGIGTDVYSDGAFTSQDYNLFGTVVGYPTAPHDLNGVNPVMASGLANNGGNTQTIQLLPGSPAIDLIPFGAAPHCNGTIPPFITDQRGQGRPSPKSGPCDSGAFEVQQ